MANPATQDDYEDDDAGQEEDDLRDQFKRDLGESRRFMEPLQQRMDKDYEVYRNWRNQVDDDALFKVSDLFEYVETIVPIVTNNRIRASVHSDYPDYVAHARGMNDILDNTYDINNWDYMSQEIMRLALIYRSSFVYSGFDKAYKNGTGKLCLNQVNARWCYIDPSVTELEDSRFFFYVQPMRKTQLYKLYPDKKSEIKESLGRTDPTMNQFGNNAAGGWFKTWLTTVKNFLVFNGSNRAKIIEQPFQSPEMDEQARHKNVVAYIEYWYRDDDDEWRKSCWADDLLLEDEENPYWHGKLPYDILSPVKDPLSAMGVPMSEQIESMGANRNLMMNYVMSNAKLHADPPLLYNTSFGNVKEPNKLKQQADDGVIPVSNPDMLPLNSVAMYMQVPVLPGYAVSMFDQLGAIKDAATGVNDSFRGTQQASSGKEVQLQQEAAYTRVKTMIDQFELLNKKVAEKIIVNAMQFHRTYRGYRVKGDYRKYDALQQVSEQQGNEMPFEVKPIQNGVDEQGEPTHDKAEFFLYANPNEWTKIKPEKQDDDAKSVDEEGDESDQEPEPGSVDSSNQGEVQKAFKILQFTVEIEAGSSLPQSRLARREEAMELYGAQAIDQESLLDTYDWPDRDEVIKRMGDKAQQAQQAQAQAEQSVEQSKQQTEQVKGQNQMAVEQLKAQTQIQIQEMKAQADMEKQKMNNEHSMRQTALQGAQDTKQTEISSGDEQHSEGQDNGLAGMLEQIRQSNPDAAQLSDEQLIQAITGQQAPQGQDDQGLAGTLDQIRQSNPEAANLSDEELINAIGGGQGEQA